MEFIDNYSNGVEKAQINTRTLAQRIAEAKDQLAQFEEMANWGLNIDDDEYKAVYSELQNLLNEEKRQKNIIKQQSIQMNAFSSEIDIAKAKLKELSLQGFDMNDDEYRKADIALQNLIDKEKKYKAEIAKQTESGKAKEAGKALKEIKSVDNALQKTTKSAKKAFSTINKGAKKSNSALASFSKRVWGLAKRIFVFSLIAKAFRSMVNGIKEGFQNFAKYSSETNKVMSEFVGATATLKNTLGAAFAPLINTVIPYLTLFINYLIKAINTIAQLVAILSGKNTWSRAKKQVKDYNKSLDDTSKSAKKAQNALAAFDDLDVLPSNNDENTNNLDDAKNMFEEVPVDPKILDWIDKIKKAFEPILNYAKELRKVFNKGFWDGLGDYQYRFDKIKKGIKQIKNVLIDIWSDPKVLNAADKWVKSLVYLIGSYIGSIASIGLTIGTFIISGLGDYLVKNKDRIKNYMIDMFDIWSEINVLLASFYQTFAYIFEAFASKNGTKVSSAIIGIFADAFMGVSLIASKLVRDLLNIIIKPFVSNKAKIRTAVEGALGTIAIVLGTIKTAIDDTFGKINNVYDEHFKPFFDDIANGLTELVGKFFDFWNKSVQPILNSLAKEFDKVWKQEIQPMINDAIDLLGSLADVLRVIWNNVLKPFIAWIITNVCPVVLPIIKEIVSTLIKMAGNIANIFGGILKIIKGILDFIVGVFTGDWKKAWKGIENIVSGVMVALGGIVKLGLNTVFGIVKTVLNSISAFFSAIFNGLGSIVKNCLQIVANVVKTILGMIKNGIWTSLLSIKNIWISIWNSLKKTVTDIFNGIWKAIKGVINSILGGIEGMANGVIAGINEVVKAMNNLKFDIPDWVPGMGGKEFGFSLKQLSKVSIPRLANGGITTGNTIAQIGDNPGGREAVLPLSSNTEWMDDLANKTADRIVDAISGINTNVYIGDRQLDDIIVRSLKRSNFITGGNAYA